MHLCQRLLLKTALVLCLTIAICQGKSIEIDRNYYYRSVTVSVLLEYVSASVDIDATPHVLLLIQQ